MFGFLKKKFMKIILKVETKHGVYYINGSDSLPPPLTKEEEEKAVESIVLTLTELKFIDKVKINVSPISDKFISFIDITKPLSDNDYISENN